MDLVQSQIDFVIPLFNEDESLPELKQRIFQTMEELNTSSFRIIFVDDGSTDKSWNIIQDFKTAHPNHILGIKLRRNKGKAFGLNIAFQKTTAPIVFTLDADLQDDPKEIPRFLEKLKKSDLVSGWKKKRHDPIDKTLPSKVFNLLVAKLTGIPLHDFNCGFKAYKGEVARNLNLYGELHRFTPVLASFYGYKISELEVEHHARKHGHSKYGFERFARGLIDLLTVVAFTRFSDRPAHLFGGFGLLSGSIGFLTLLYLATIKLFLGEHIGHRPLLQFGILLVILSIQLLSLGIMAELIIRKNKISMKDDSFVESNI
jgi:glycosyltransferase involved in cell wall biosynthesis